MNQVKMFEKQLFSGNRSLREDNSRTKSKLIEKYFNLGKFFFLEQRFYLKNLSISHYIYQRKEFLPLISTLFINHK
jgi:hypothetical protein